MDVFLYFKSLILGFQLNSNFYIYRFLRLDIVVSILHIFTCVRPNLRSKFTFKVN